MHGKGKSGLITRQGCPGERDNDMEIVSGEEDTLEMGPEVEMGPSDIDDEYSDEE